MSEYILYGSGFAGWRILPFGKSSPPEYPPSASLLKPQDTTHRDGVQRKWGRASTTARQPRISMLSASFSAISATIFLVYMCNLFVRKTIKTAKSINMPSWSHQWLAGEAGRDISGTCFKGRDGVETALP